jgi:hypothetical protein
VSVAVGPNKASSPRPKPLIFLVAMRRPSSDL